MIAKKFLSHFSVLFIQEEAERMGSLTKNKWLRKLSNEFIKEDRYGMQHAPCFNGFQVLLQNALTDKTPIWFKIRRILQDNGEEIDQCNLFYTAHSTTYELQPIFNNPPKQACYVIESVSVTKQDKTLSKQDFIKDLSQYDLTQLILASCATHPNYGGELQQLPSLSIDDEKEFFKEIALKEGFCKKNPQRCSLLHIYSAMIPESITFDL